MIPVENYIKITDISGIINTFLMLGVVAASINGALRAIDLNTDITGAFMFGIIGAIAGGTMRDVMLGINVFWIDNHMYIWLPPTISCAVFLIMYINSRLINHKKLHSMLLISDTLALAACTIAGVQKTLALGNGYIIATAMGLCTSVGSGIVVDVISNRIPRIFASELYFTVSLIGAIVFLLLIQVAIFSIAGFIAMMFMIFLRLLAVKYNWRLPIFSYNKVNK